MDKIQERPQAPSRNLEGQGVEALEETAPPEAVKAAFDDVIKAREDEVRVRNEADAYSNQILPEARGEAQRYYEEAEGYSSRVVAQAQGEAARFDKLYVEYKLAPEVTRERMYIDTMESVMSNSTKILIDVEGGNNLLYLPLDKLMQQSSGSNNFGGSERAAANTNTVNLPPNSRRDRR